MSLLKIYPDTEAVCMADYAELDAIARQLNSIGVYFDRWQTEQPLDKTSEQADVIAVYKSEIDQLNKEYNFKTIDVVSLEPDHPQRAAMREKFLNEHTHTDFELRFFVAGRGVFYLHVESRVFILLCEQGDLISIPANMRHWFDMGEYPDFTCIRLFCEPEGWVADFTGSDISTHFPDFKTVINCNE